MKHLFREAPWLLAAVITLVAVEQRCQAETISIKGSDTMVILAQKWAEVYLRRHPTVNIQVTGGGSGVGFAALQNRTTDLANASREIKATEILGCIRTFHQRPEEYIVALDGLSIYVNQENPVEELTLAQLALIFTGKVKNWAAFGGPDHRITVYGRENSSGTYEFFKEKVLDHADFTAKAQTMPGTAAVLQAVAKDTTGIGYGGAAYGKGAKTLRVRRSEGDPGYYPTEKNVVERLYPIWRHLYVYVNPAIDQGALKDYLRWIRTEAGQQIVKQVGYYPLPSHLRPNGNGVSDSLFPPVSEPSGEATCSL